MDFVFGNVELRERAPTRAEFPDELRERTPKRVEFPDELRERTPKRAEFPRSATRRGSAEFRHPPFGHAACHSVDAERSQRAWAMRLIPWLACQDFINDPRPTIHDPRHTNLRPTTHKPRPTTNDTQATSQGPGLAWLGWLV